MQTIAISNHKGGTGKTALTHSLGYVLASDHGQRVLMIDADPQASLTGACGMAGAAYSLADVLGGTQHGKLELKDIIKQVDNNLDLAPADIALAPSELGLVTRLNRETILARALAKVSKNYDVCLIDCPPSLSLLTVNAIAAADAVLIPTQPSGVDLRGLALFMSTLEAIQGDLSPDLELIGIVVTFYDGRLNTHQAAMEAMKAAARPVLEPTIGRSVRVAEAAADGETVLTFEPRNPRADEYRQLSEIIYQWIERGE